MPRLPLLACATVLGACGHAVQMTSGKAFAEATDADVARSIDAEIARVASVEPNLRFPARIGVARIVNGDLTLPPGGGPSAATR